MPGEEVVKTDEDSSKLTMILGVAAVGVLSFLFGKFVLRCSQSFSRGYSLQSSQERQVKSYWKLYLS